MNSGPKMRSLISQTDKLAELEEKMRKEQVLKQNLVTRINASEKELSALRTRSEQLTSSQSQLHTETKHCEAQSMKLGDAVNDVLKRMEFEDREIKKLEFVFNRAREETRRVNEEIAKEKEAVQKLREVADQAGIECAHQEQAKDDLHVRIQDTAREIDRVARYGADLKIQADTITAAMAVAK